VTSAVVWAVTASFGLLALTLVGYPLIVRARAALRRGAGRGAAPTPRDAAPHVTVIVASRDEPAVLEARVRNLRDTDHPAGRLDVVVAVDARAPHPWTEVAARLRGLAEVVPGDEPGGKAAALNAAVRTAGGDVLVFADAGQRFNREAIPALVAALAEDGVGAVSGVVVSAKDDGLMDRYWEYELQLRRRQAAIHSIICVSGAIYALRRELWRPMPAQLICDDLFVTMGLTTRGWRVGFCEAARAVDPREFTREQHFDRKVRTLTGLLQLCAWMPEILLPWRNAIWVDLVLHKLTRIVVPYLFILGVAGVAWLVLALGGPVTWGVAAAGAVAASLLVLARPGLRKSLFWAARLLTVPVIALGNALRGRWQVWQPHGVAASRPRVTTADANA
jgi:cellulose synthase/poly-beta-1,6-N-acetylglucosamine synthase-like glycosyltransferase